MKETKIYLAGAMDYATAEHQTAWRIQATDLLRDFGVKTFDPCRRPHGTDLNPKEIFNLDLKELNNSDIVLYDYRNNDIKQFGSPCELMYFSYVLKRPVLAWYDKDFPHEREGIFQQVLIDRKFPSLEEACDHITTYYL